MSTNSGSGGDLAGPAPTGGPGGFGSRGGQERETPAGPPRNTAPPGSPGRPKPNLRRSRDTLIMRLTSPGADPGVLVVAPDAERSKISVMAYGPEGLVEKDVRFVEEIAELREKHTNVWVNVDGFRDLDKLLAIREMFGLHPLAMEDVVNVFQRPKLDHYPEHIFVVARTVERFPDIETDQIAMFVGHNFVCTMQAKAGDPLDPVRRRLRTNSNNVRNRGAGYLAYALMDTMIDSYFPILEKYGDRIEELEDIVIANPDPQVISEIYQVKRDLLVLRKAMWPLREVLNGLLREPAECFDDETKLHFRDCYDHAVQIIDLIETFREMCSSLMEVYLSSLSTRMNEVMKVLTIISTLFIPLTFVAGIYGMNFDNMPELHSEWGYYICWGVMLVIAAAEFWYFYQKGWLGNSMEFKAPDDVQAAAAAVADKTLGNGRGSSTAVGRDSKAGGRSTPPDPRRSK